MHKRKAVRKSATTQAALKRGRERRDKAARLFMSILGDLRARQCDQAAMS
jgi:hypothetical protein